MAVFVIRFVFVISIPWLNKIKLGNVPNIFCSNFTGAWNHQMRNSKIQPLSCFRIECLQRPKLHEACHVQIYILWTPGSLQIKKEPTEFVVPWEVFLVVGKIKNSKN